VSTPPPTVGAAAERVTTLELFFDLVFVFAITQLTSALSHHMTLTGAAQVALMLSAIWWMYAGYAWLTNAVSPDTTARRLIMLAAMAAWLVLALAVPHAFGGDGVAFGLAYLAVVVLHAWLYSRSTNERVVTSILYVARFNLAGAALLILGGALGGGAQYVLWAAVFLATWVASRLFIDVRGFEIGSAHFVERHGLVVIIAIGESVVAVGIAAGDLAMDAGLVVAAALGLALSACLWWAYFGRDDDAEAEAAMERADGDLRPLLALEAFGYWHLPLLAGIVAIAAGEKHAIAEPGHTIAFADALALGAGAAAFLLGDVLFRQRLGIGRSGLRGAAALVALATIPLGTAVAASVQLAALVAVIAGALALEGRNPGRPALL
jgi:low temperature requirement protein LtrA